MWPDRVSNPEPLPFESDALPTALCDPAVIDSNLLISKLINLKFYKNVDN